jgi:predicted DNA-binding transcriptional regulator AlpA
VSERLIRINEVRELTGLCRSAVYSAAGFPKPIKLPTGGDGSKGRASAWIFSEVVAWIQTTISASRREGVGASNG